MGIEQGSIKSGHPVVVSATDLDIRDLVFATDKVDVSGSAVTISGAVAVTQSTSPWVISGAVTNTVLSVVGGGTEATAQRVTIANDSTGVLSVDDNGGSITVDATDLDVRDLNVAQDAVGAQSTKSASATSTAITVGATSTTVLASNSSRLKAVIVNDSDEDIYLKYGSGAALHSGILLKAAGGAIIEEMYTGIITGICVSGSKVLTLTHM